MSIMVRSTDNTNSVNFANPSEIIAHYQNKISTLKQASEITKVQKDIEELVYKLFKSTKYVPPEAIYADIFKSLQIYLKSNQVVSNIDTWIEKNTRFFNKDNKISPEHQTLLLRLGRVYLDLEKKLNAKKEVEKKASATSAPPHSQSTEISVPKMNILTIIHKATPKMGLEVVEIKEEINKFNQVKDIKGIQEALADKALQGLEAASNNSSNGGQNNLKKYWEPITKRADDKTLITDTTAFPRSFREDDKKFIIQLAQLYNHCNARIPQLQQDKDQVFKDKFVALLRKEPKDETELGDLYAQAIDPRITKDFLQNTFEQFKLDASLLTSLLNIKGRRASAMITATEDRKGFLASFPDAKKIENEYKPFVKSQLDNFIDKILKDKCLDYVDSPKYRNNWLFGSCGRKLSIHTLKVEALHKTLTEIKKTPVQSLQQATTQTTKVAEAIADHREQLFGESSVQNLRDLNIFLKDTFPAQYASFDMPHNTGTAKRKEICAKLPDMRTNLINTITKHIDPRSSTQQQNVQDHSKQTP